MCSNEHGKSPRPAATAVAASSSNCSTCLVGNGASAGLTVQIRLLVGRSRSGGNGRVRKVSWQGKGGSLPEAGPTLSRRRWREVRS